MARFFVYEGREFPDQHPDKTPEQVKEAMTDFYPELANADVSKSEKEGNEYFEFRKKVGTKGD